MALPWVSRELYERALADLKEERAFRKELMERLLGPSPLVEALAEVLPDPASPEARDLIDPINGELTGSAIRRMAQAAANKRAGR